MRLRGESAKKAAKALGLRPKRRVQSGERSSDDIKQGLHATVRAIVGGWDTDFRVRQRSIREARKMLRHHDPEVKIAAIKVIQAADAMRIKAIDLADRIHRLDNDKPTEVVRFKPMSFGAES